MVKLFLILGLFVFCSSSFAREYSVEVISQKTHIEINNGKLNRETCYEIRINDRAGEKYTTVTIPGSKLINVTGVKAYIKDSGGRIVKKLRKNDIVEKSAISDFSFYEDNFVKEFTLRHNTYPYILVYSYQVQQNEFFYIDNWCPIIDERIPTHSAQLVVTVPQDYPVSFKNRHVEKPVAEAFDNKIEYRWKASYTEIIKPEVHSPPTANFLPSVYIVPEEFHFDIKGSFSDWISFGNWQYNLLQGLNELPDEEKDKIQKLTDNTDDDKEKIKRLYHYLQDETRYINVSIETGGLKPYPAAYVARNKYGDCKALTNYFKSMLDYLQIPSYYAKVYAGSPVKEIDIDFPSQQSNHVIIYIPLKNEDIWLDCTSDGAFNYLGTFTQNRDAFVVDFNNSNFKKTPALQPNDVLNTRKILFKYNGREALVTFRNSYKGNLYENILHLENNFNESEKTRIISNYFVDDGFQLLNYQLSGISRDSVKIDLNYEASSQKIYKHYGNDILIENIAFSLPDFEKPDSRKLPVQIDYPLYEADTLVYEIPAGYKLVKNQDSYSIETKFGKHTFNICEIERNIIVTKSILINPGYYPVSEYTEFYDFYKRVLETENKTHLSLNKINHE